MFIFDYRGEEIASRKAMGLAKRRRYRRFVASKTRMPDYQQPR